MVTGCASYHPQNPDRSVYLEIEAGKEVEVVQRETLSWMCEGYTPLILFFLFVTLADNVFAYFFENIF
jgi:hypothetical protein